MAIDDGFVDNLDQVLLINAGAAEWVLEWEWEGANYRGECEFGHSRDERCPAETSRGDNCARSDGHELPHIPGLKGMGMELGLLIVSAAPIED
jgi:hypothetical protein